MLSSSMPLNNFISYPFFSKKPRIKSNTGLINSEIIALAFSKIIDRENFASTVIDPFKSNLHTTSAPTFLISDEIYTLTFSFLFLSPVNFLTRPALSEYGNLLPVVDILSAYNL